MDCVFDLYHDRDPTIGCSERRDAMSRPVRVRWVTLCWRPMVVDKPPRDQSRPLESGLGLPIGEPGATFTVGAESDSSRARALSMGEDTVMTPRPTAGGLS